jgi:hypothetical protein
VKTAEYPARAAAVDHELGFVHLEHDRAAGLHGRLAIDLVAVERGQEG